MSKYRFNKEQLKFVEDKLGVTGKIRVVVRYLLLTVLLAIFYYIIIAFFVNTPAEERLIKENELKAQQYREAVKKMEVLDNVIQNLENRDRDIYQSIFKSEPPEIFPVNNRSVLYAQLDSSSDDQLVLMIASKVKLVESMLVDQNKKIEAISVLIKNNPDVKSIPSILPIKGIEISQTGAGIGKRIHPFFKTAVDHTGLDLIASLGAQIHATADGVVSEITKTGDKGSGNVLVISHSNGYVTKYAHLGDILVRKGQPVKQGAIIARVGNSGLSFAPHLHYEVILNGEVMDPVDYFFADLSPEQYREMKIIAMSSGQSLD
ncbi:MAG TPA: M23 family metallopeptidase [Bacteroidales bacterium]|nr:M23 family metallopeptidase [Bacteroidales bacterium]